MNKNIKKEIGTQLFNARKNKKMTRATLGKLLDLHESTVKRYEDGEIKTVSVEKLMEFAKALELNPGELLLVANAIPTKIMSAKAPLYGSISAGTPIEMIEAIDYLDIPDRLKAQYPKAFYLEVNGDSMNKVVPPKSYALINPVTEVNNGEIAAVAINNDEATLKRFYRTSNSIILEPESHNDDHKSQLYDCNNVECENIRILGKLIWHMPPMDVNY